MRLDGKSAIVVGAANGIGRATALAFAAAGAAVACADVEAAGAKTTAADIEKSGGRAMPVHLDVTESAECGGYCATTIVAMLVLMRYRHSTYSMAM